MTADNPRKYQTHDLTDTDHRRRRAHGRLSELLLLLHDLNAETLDQGDREAVVDAIFHAREVRRCLDSVGRGEASQE